MSELTVASLFVGKVMLNALTAPTTDVSHAFADKQQTTVSKALTYNDMVKSIIGGYAINQTRLMQQVNQSLVTRRAYTQLLKQLSFSYSGQQVAASSDEEFSARSNEYFSIDFKRDKTFKEQVYVLLNIINPLERHLNQPIALHIVHEAKISYLHFNALIEGKSQQLLDMNDEALTGLLHSDSEIFIY